MSVVAWDGVALAADCMLTCGDYKSYTSKIKKLNDGTLLAWTGQLDSGLLMMQWFENGERLIDWPLSQRDKESWSRLIVVKSVSEVYWYEQWPIPQRLDERHGYYAWGSGAAFALGALAAGANAVRAVEAANVWSTSCGLGIEAFTAKGA